MLAFNAFNDPHRTHEALEDGALLIFPMSGEHTTPIGDLVEHHQEEIVTGELL